MKEQKWFDRICCAIFIIQVLLGAALCCYYCYLQSAQLLITVALLGCGFALISLAAWKGRMPFLLLGLLVAGIILNSTMNYSAYHNVNVLFIMQGILAAIWGITGTVLQIKNHIPMTPQKVWIPVFTVVILAGTFLAVWAYHVEKDKEWNGHAKRTIWAVPEKYDSGENTEPGTVEELIYDTKAYATDGRAVQKRALVYLPYGYDKEKQYNILYLMHGTGDDENYWLKTHAYNKVMLDRLIAQGEINPLIVVTPTFYVEDDCKENLDALTFSFREELRNDLMPSVESRYATYAESIDPEGFRKSRDHRAFAGLSRGAVTTCHSAFCGSLDYFSWFGMFSAYRTEESYLRQTLQSDAQAGLPIHYLYMTTGNFDFAAAAQVQGYRQLTDVEPRLQQGVNTSFDMFPMRYHSIGSWHLALYNFLQKIF